MTVSIIKTDGSEDYSTIQAWEDACPSDITATGTDENWEGELFNEEFLNTEGAVTFGGITTDSTHFLKMRPVTGGGFRDNMDPDIDVLRYDASKGCGIRVTTNFLGLMAFGDFSGVRLEVTGLQMYCDGFASPGITKGTHSQPLIMDSCILAVDGNYGNTRVLDIYWQSGDKSVIKNSVIMHTGTSREIVTGREVQFKFCSVYGSPTRSIALSGYGVHDFKGCLFLNSLDWQAGSENHTVDHCVGDFASWESSTATNSVLNATASDEIESDTGDETTVDMRIKGTGSAYNAAAPISGITTDIYGRPRDITSPTAGAMEYRADVTSLIKTDGSGDYTSWQAWEDACPADITAAGDKGDWIGEGFNEEFVGTEAEVTFGGITTDASSLLRIRPVSGGGFQDSIDPETDPLRLDATVGTTLTSTTNFKNILDFGSSGVVRCSLDGLQLRASGLATDLIRSDGHLEPLLIDSCILGQESDWAGTNSIVIRAFSGAYDRSIITNSVIISTGTLDSTLRGGRADISFCTLYGPSAGDQLGSTFEAFTFTNCLFLNTTGFEDLTEDHTVDYCVTNLASWDSSTATNSVLNATPGNEIESDTGVYTTVDLRTKSGGDCDGGGTPISGILVDIFGRTRDLSTPTVGAFEVIGGAPAAFQIAWAHYRNIIIQGNQA